MFLVALTVALAACASPSGQRSTVSSQQGSAAPRQRDYWPTNGWRTAPPKAQGMDPAVLAAIAGNVSSLYPQVRSVLVVRHGYLVYERQGVVPNSEMLVMREGSLIGKIRISSVEPTTSIGDIITNSLARGVQVQPGDIVIYAGNTRS